MPVGSSSTGGVTVGVASAYCVVLQSPAAAPQVPANVQGELLVFLMVTLPAAEVMIAVSPGCVSSMHWTVRAADPRGAFLQHHGGLAALRQDIEDGAAHADRRERGG